METMTDFWSRGSFCHTEDRENMVAQAECGLGLMAPTDPLWENAVKAEFLKQNWPNNQGTIPSGCTEKYFPDSWTNIEIHRTRITSYIEPVATCDTDF